MPHWMSGSGYSPTAQPTIMAMNRPGIMPKFEIILANLLVSTTCLKDSENRM